MTKRYYRTSEISSHIIGLISNRRPSLIVINVVFHVVRMLIMDSRGYTKGGPGNTLRTQRSTSWEKEHAGLLATSKTLKNVNTMSFKAWFEFVGSMRTWFPYRLQWSL